MKKLTCFENKTFIIEYNTIRLILANKNNLFPNFLIVLLISMYFVVQTVQTLKLSAQYIYHDVYIKIKTKIRVMY